MVTYKYKAVSKDGQKVSGVIEAYNEFDAVERIKETCNVVLKISEVQTEKTGLLNMEVGGNRLNAKAFTVMCSQFSIILSSGVPIIRATRLIADKTTDKTLKKILNSVAEDVEGGRSLASSFAERGEKVLPMTFIETIRAGEESGSVDKAFDTMYRHYDKQTQMASKVKSALSYPLFVLAIAVVVVIVLMVYVLPTFMEIFESYGSDLPLMTRMLIAISNFFQKWTWLLLVIAAIIFIAYKVYTNTEEGRLKVAKLALKIPVFGNISTLNAASQFANTMTTMLGAGIGLAKSISITAKVIDNYYVSQEIGKLTGKLEEGRTLGGSMKESGVMPDILVDMVAVGEETGEMEHTLDTIAKYYDAELDYAINSALKKLEPTLLVVMAVIAGFIVIAIYGAMFDMYSVM